MPRLRNHPPILDFSDLAPGRELPLAIHERLFQVNNSYRVPISNLVYIIDNHLISYHLIGSTWKVRTYKYRRDSVYSSYPFDIRFTRNNRWDYTYNIWAHRGKIIFFSTSPTSHSMNMSRSQLELVNMYLDGVADNRMIEGREICQD